MNQAQRKLVVSWWLALSGLLIIGIFDEWILKYWDILWLPVLAIIILGIELRKNTVSYSGGRERTLEIIERYPIIKIWLVVYTLCIAVMLLVVQSKGINLREYLGPFEFILLLLPIFGPIWIVVERSKYLFSGKQSDPRM